MCCSCGGGNDDYDSDHRENCIDTNNGARDDGDDSCLWY